jgi:hypothetical protein
MIFIQAGWTVELILHLPGFLGANILARGAICGEVLEFDNPKEA